jgi:hypothetical protein
MDEVGAAVVGVVMVDAVKVDTDRIAQWSR